LINKKPFIFSSFILLTPINRTTNICIHYHHPVREGDGCVPEPPIPCDEGFVREGDGCVPEPEPVATEEIDCELQPELCEVNFVEIPNVQLEETEEEELPEEEELTETTEFEEVEEESSEEEDSGGSDGEISE
jgi:hypothetical protein